MKNRISNTTIPIIIKKLTGINAIIAITLIRETKLPIRIFRFKLSELEDRTPVFNIFL